MHCRGHVSTLEQLQPLGALVAGRSGIDHASAADGRLRAQHDTVAAGCDGGSRESQLRVALSDPPHHGGYLGGAMVDVDAGAVTDRLELLQRDVQPVAHGIRAWLDERITAPQLRPFDAGQADGDPLPCLGGVDRAVVHLHAAHADVEPGRFRAQLVARPDPARPERARGHGADAVQREDAVDEEPRRSRRVNRRHGVRRRRERRSQLVQPVPCLRARRDDRGARRELACLFRHERERLLVHRVRLCHGDDAALDAEQPEDGEVLVRLRPRALAGVDDQEEEIDAGRTRDHRSHEALVARNVDE